MTSLLMGSSDTQHQGILSGTHEGWRQGATCGECQEALLQRRIDTYRGSPTLAGRLISSAPIDEFWATGDPQVFQRQLDGRRAART